MLGLLAVTIVESLSYLKREHKQKIMEIVVKR